jgi:hypothetical protein
LHVEARGGAIYSPAPGFCEETFPAVRRSCNRFAARSSGKTASDPTKGADVSERETLSDDEILTTGAGGETRAAADDDSTDTDTDTDTGDDADDTDSDADDTDA